MNPLQHRLDSLRRSLVMVALWRGTCGVLALVVGATLFAGLLDWQLHLPSALRALLLVGILGASGYVATRFLIVPLAKPSDNLSLALRIEEVYPELNDVLGSSIQFLEQPAGEQDESKVLKKKAVEQAEKRAENCDFTHILDRRGVFLLPLAALLVGLGAAHFAYHHTGLSWTALCRLGDPFGNHTWTQINMETQPARIAEGQLFVIKGELTGIVPAQARLEVEGMVRLDKSLQVKRDAELTSGLFMTQLDMTQQRTGKFKFRILANDATFPARGAWHEVQVLPPPRLTALDGLPSPQITLDFPAYTDLPSPKKLTAGQGYIEAVAGTRVTWQAAVDRPVSEAWLQMLPENPLHLLALQLAPLGQGQPLDFLALATLSQTVVGRNPCTISEKGTRLSAQFTPWLPGSYWLHFEDEDRLGNDYKNDLRTFFDPPPLVHLKRPGSSQSLLKDAVVTLQMLVEDEVYAVRSIHLEYRRKGPDGVWLDAEPQRVPLMEQDFIAKQVPRLLAGLAKTWAGDLPDWRLRPRKLELTSRWPLAHRFLEGQTVIFRVCADDFNDLFTPRILGYSHDVELRIVSKTELAQQLDDDFSKIQNDVVRMQGLQEQALKIVKEVLEERKKDPKGALNKNQHDKVVEAEQLQQQLQERIGAKQESGLRQELEKIKQKMTDNQLPGSDLKDRIEALSTLLDRLVREDLQQIEAKLAEARKQLPANANPKSNTPQKKESGQKKDPLEQAKNLQEDAKKTLDELAKFLDPWANLQQIKAETRRLLTQQKDLKRDTDGMKGSANDKDFQDELRKKAELQDRLASKAQELMNTMKDVKDKQKASDTGQKVGDALKIAEKADLPGKLGEARDAIKNATPNEAEKQQREAIKTMEKMLAALEKEQRDEELDKLRKKQKKSEHKLDELAQEMDKLQKKIKNANNLADPEERAEALKKLAKEEEQLKEKLQDEARELAQLRADKASRDAAKAAQELDQAGKKLQNGEDPGEAMEEARAKLKQAQKDLEEAEEELAREQLSRVADRIVALKEHQDAAIAESERIHKDLERKKGWSNGLLRSLKVSSESQKNLVQEAESLQEKLKDAKVFEYIIMKAGKSMTKASDAIMNRAKSVVKRSEENMQPLEEPLEKEELAAEKKTQEKILGLQKDASERLQWLLDAIKQEPPQKVAQQPMEQPKEDPKEGEEKKQPKRAIPGDGIPGQAQIKLLIREQEELKQRTKEFDELHPNRDNLNEEQQAELRSLEEDQARIRILFGGLMSKNQEEKGDEP